ncbi:MULTISPECIES: phosphatase PAP2 family protein [Stappiaceae]|jgi:membrane-associated PAP2 superfamily phosphatase|uniref:phosphatase PAP2 family protein n=1 Tax=Stappiaceae TaxID=2821832 RepID=UPI0010626D5F|nr:phosphatase PAP2 family protein [Labrenzia sp. R4_1]MBO9427305.1 phosphatase PAP2 family protein [Labrenzia sp. R4_1]
MIDTRLTKHIQNIASSKAVAWCIAHPFLATIAYVALVSAFFLAFPRTDLWVSGLFYSQTDGFWAQHNPFLQKVRHLGPYLVQTIAICSVAILVIKLLLPGRPPIVPLRKPVFLISTLILGPGILVNSILKDNWGRPRPRSIEEFGGELPFQPVWKMTDYCERNCSFTSGEGAAGIWLVTMAFLVPASWRKAVLAFVLPLCLILSINRVAFGGHFFSDTMLSWGLTFLVILSVYWLLYLKKPPLMTDQGLDEWFTRNGRRLHRLAKRLLVRLRQALRGSGSAQSES